MFTIRPFEGTDADYEIMNAIDAAVFHEYPRTADEWKRDDETRDARYLFRRELIELNGDVIAFGEYGQSQWHYHPQKYFFHFLVHPDHEHPDARKFYFDHVMGVLAERDPIAITSGMLEDRRAYVDFLLGQGFKETLRLPLSQLDLAGFDPAPFAGVQDNVQAAGIRIVSVAELRRTDPDWQRKIYDLHWEVLQDVPSSDPPQKPTFEDFVKRSFEDPNFVPEAYLVALDGDRYVGLTALWITPSEPEKLLTGLTGVSRSHRRRGIAMALKLRAIDSARKRGIKVIETGNEENNPMFQINLKLGFKARPAWVEFEKRLRAEAEQQ